MLGGEGVLGVVLRALCFLTCSLLAQAPFQLFLHTQVGTERLKEKTNILGLMFLPKTIFLCLMAWAVRKMRDLRKAVCAESGSLGGCQGRRKPTWAPLRKISVQGGLRSLL